MTRLSAIGSVPLTSLVGTQSSPTLGPPRVLGRYGFTPGAPEQLARLINAFAPVAGFASVPVDSEVSPLDAQRIVAIQRMLFTRYVCDAVDRKAALAKLETQLDTAARYAAQEIGIVVSPEQMWVSMHEQSILARLPEAHRRIASRELKPCTPGGAWAMLGLAVVGVLVVRGQGAPRRRRRR